MKKKIIIMFILLGVISLGVGIYFETSSLSSVIKKSKIKTLTLEEATNLLNVTYPVNSNLYYELIDETDTQYIYFLKNDSKKQDYIVDKITKQVLVSYYAN